MPCKAPAFARDAQCPGPAGQPARLRCKRCARGLCEAPNSVFRADCAGPDGHPPQMVCPSCMRKKQLALRRGSISGLMGQGASGMALQQGWTQRVDVIAEEMFNECMAGNAPCNFAFCLAGSGARNEASAYSDLDCFILVSNSSVNNVSFFEQTMDTMRKMLLDIEIGGLRLCTIMTPLGGGTAVTPKLIRTPHDMADLVEWPENQIEPHITGGLQENRFLFGTRALYDDFKTDLNLIVAKNCYSFSSRPKITRGKQLGLKTIRDVVNDPKFQPPNPADRDFHVKEQFYRPVQFIAKGLAWYYGLDVAGTALQLQQLMQGNHMSQVVANNFTTVMNMMAKYRFQLHLDAEGEKDFIYTDQNARNQEMQVLQNKGQHSLSQPEKDRLGRLKAGTYMTPQQVKDLTSVIPNLKFIMRLAREFVKQKDKLLGKRGNPFTMT